MFYVLCLNILCVNVSIFVYSSYVIVINEKNRKQNGKQNEKQKKSIED